MKVYRATTRNVEDALSWILKKPVHELNFKRLSELPALWRHACVRCGVVKLEPKVFTYDDGSKVYYAVCPKFPACNVVIYFIEECPYVNMGY